MGRKGPEARRGAAYRGIDPGWMTAGRRAMGGREPQK